MTMPGFTAEVALVISEGASGRVYRIKGISANGPGTLGLSVVAAACLCRNGECLCDSAGECAGISANCAATCTATSVGYLCVQ